MEGQIYNLQSGHSKTPESEEFNAGIIDKEDENTPIKLFFEIYISDLNFERALKYQKE